MDGYRPNPADVFRRLVAVLSHFADFTGPFAEPSLLAEFFATYLLTTWFAPAFPVHPLLWLTGDHGAGKSRLLGLLARFSHLGLLFQALPPPAALRDVAGLGASLAVDDAHFLSRPAAALGGAARPALLLAGRQRGALLAASQPIAGGPRGARRTCLLDVSGPRLFASDQQPHPAIAAYCLVVPLFRSNDPARLAADPANPAAWPPGLTLRDLTDDLWALALSRLRDLPPHLAPVVAQAALPGPSHLGMPGAPLLGAALQPWHALLAVASWLADLGAEGVTGLLDRLLALARAYHAQRPAYQSAGHTVLALQALFHCASDQFNTHVHEYLAGLDWLDAHRESALEKHIQFGPSGPKPAAAPAPDARDDDDGDLESDQDPADDGGDDDDGDLENDPADDAGDDDDGDLENDQDPADDAGDDDDGDLENDQDPADDAADDDDGDSENDQDPADQFDERLYVPLDPDNPIEANIRRTGFPYIGPPVFTFNATAVQAAMQRLAQNQEWGALPPDKITPVLVGHLLGQLGLQHHRTARLRSWTITAVGLVRLAGAYSLPVPAEMAIVFPSASAKPNPAPSTAP